MTQGPIDPPNEQAPRDVDLLRDIFFGSRNTTGTKATPSNAPPGFDPSKKISSRVVSSIFNQKISSKWDQFLTAKDKRDNPSAPSVQQTPESTDTSSSSSPTPRVQTPTNVSAPPKKSSTPEEMSREKANEDLVNSSKEQAKILGEVRDELDTLNDGMAEIIEKGIKVEGGMLGGDGSGGGGLLDTLGGGGRRGGAAGGRPSLIRRVGGGVRRFAGTRGGKAAIAGLVLGAGAWGLNKLFGGDDEEPSSEEESLNQQEMAAAADQQPQVTSADYAPTVASAVALPAAVGVGSMAAKAVAPSAAKAGVTAAAKAGGKSLFGSLLKKIPGVGLIVGTGMAIGRALDGDFAGAVGEFASGVASTVPGLGTLASVAIDGGLAIRDVNKAMEEQEAVVEESTKQMEEQNQEAAQTPPQPSQQETPAPKQEPVAPTVTAVAPLTERAVMAEVTGEPTSPLRPNGQPYSSDPRVRSYEEKADQNLLRDRGYAQADRDGGTSSREISSLYSRMNPEIVEVPLSASQVDANAVQMNGPNPEEATIAVENRAYDKELSELGMQTSLMEEMVDALTYLKDKAAEGASSGFGGFGGLLGTIGGGIGGFFSGVADLFTGGSSSGGTPPASGPGLSARASVNPAARETARNLSGQGLGALSARFESASGGSKAIGWDSTGGTSYGKYQIASRTGTFDSFLKYAEQQGDAGAEVAARLRAAGPANTGSRSGAAVDEWRRLEAEGKLGTLEHDFIKATHFDPAFENIKNEGLRAQIQDSKALQDVLWSTSVQHGAVGKGRGAADIFNKVYREGMSEQDLIDAVYQDRGGRFGSSTAQVQASVANRFNHERTLAQQMLVAEREQKATQQTVQVAEAQKPTEQQVPGEAQTTTPAVPQMTQDQLMAKRQELEDLEFQQDVQMGPSNRGRDRERAQRIEALRTEIAQAEATPQPTVAEGPRSETSSGESTTKTMTVADATPQEPITPQVTSPAPQSGIQESVRLETAIAQQNAPQTSGAMVADSSSSSIPPGISNQAGPIPDGGYDKLTAVARGDTA